jgi:hypothetical protein
MVPNGGFLVAPLLDHPVESSGQVADLVLRSDGQRFVETAPPRLRGHPRAAGGPERAMQLLSAFRLTKRPAKVRDAVRRPMGKSPKQEEATPRASRPRPNPRRTAH